MVGCLAGEKPQMISAAVKGVARLTYEFSDLIASAYNLLPSTFLLLQRRNKEITKVSFLSSLSNGHNFMLLRVIHLSHLVINETAMCFPFSEVYIQFILENRQI